MRSLLQLVPATVLAAIVCEILLISGAYVAAAYSFLAVDPFVWLLYDDGWVRIAMMVLGIVIGLYLQDLYDNLRVVSQIMLFQQISLVFGVAFLFQALLSYLAPQLVLPRRPMIAGSVFLLFALPLLRTALSQALAGALAGDRVLFLGASPVSLQIAQRIRERPELGMAVAGFLEDSDKRTLVPEEDYAGPVEALRDVVREKRIERIVVGMLERRQRMPVYDLLDLGFAGIRVEEVATTFEQVFQRVCTEQIRPSQLIFTRELGPRPYVVQLQSIYSWILAAVLLVLSAPVMILAAILVRMTSPGPALYSQTRVGKNGAHFTIYKFRSMRADAEAKTGAVWAQKNDPRITPIGRFLRKSRIDELPQLFNVLRGEMAFVGPRPERPEFVEMLSKQIPFYPQRHVVKPGITGWAQINHKYGDTIEDTVKKLEYDLYYIKNLSLTMDFLIIFHTAKVMLLSRGAQ
jgi:sugar transferase (PEP-CTERM system associated)